MILRSIAGRENQPAESVFKNIKILKGVPAGRLVNIMNMGFGRSLGVSCGFCHVPGQVGSRRQGGEEHRAAHVRDGADDQSRLHGEGAERSWRAAGGELLHLPQGMAHPIQPDGPPGNRPPGAPPNSGGL